MRSTFRVFFHYSIEKRGFVSTPEVLYFSTLSNLSTPSITERTTWQPSISITILFCFCYFQSFPITLPFHTSLLYLEVENTDHTLYFTLLFPTPLPHIPFLLIPSLLCIFFFTDHSNPLIRYALLFLTSSYYFATSLIFPHTF